MNSQLKSSRFFYLFRRSYLIVYFVLLMCRVIVPSSVVVPSVIDQIVFSALAIIGVLLILLDAFTQKYIWNTKFKFLLIGFLLVMAITSLLNMKYGLFNNFKTIIWTAIQFFVFYGMAANADKEEIIKEIKIISNLLIIIWFILSFGAIVMYALQIGYTVESSATPYIIRQGFVDSRLFGWFKDPNYAAVTSCTISLLSIVNIRFNKNRLLRTFYIINIIIQYIYIILSGSRTAAICSVAALSVGGLLFFYHLVKTSHSHGLPQKFASAISVVCCLAAVGISLLLTSAVRQGLMYVPSVVNQTFHLKYEQDNKGNKPIDLDRPDVVDNEDISNLRFKIWASGFEIFESKPVFGVSPRNVIPYAKDQFPTGFVAVRSYQLHNGYLDVLVETGVVGAAIMLVFIVCMIATVVRYFLFKKAKNNYFLVSMCLLVFLSIACSAFFICEIFFVNTIGTTLFWLFLGYLVSLISNDGIKTKPAEPILDAEKMEVCENLKG